MISVGYPNYLQENPFDRVWKGKKYV